MTALAFASGSSDFFAQLDQLPVTLLHGAVGFLPLWLRPVASAAISVAAILMVFPGLFALTTVLERKGLGRMQNRMGPNRVGPLGIFQPVADGIKSLTKEDVVPFSADHAVHFLAPVVLVVAIFLGFSVLPIGRNMILADMDAGLLFYFAVGASTELAIFMAGWSSRNKYSLLGAMRAIAQMIGYEVPLLLAALSAVMMAGTLSTGKIVEAQGGFTHGLPRWFVFTPWGAAGLVLFVIASLAETNRSPFDLPEGESELVAGYFTEYSGFKFALFFLGEYLGMFTISGIAITLFLGGWGAPLEALAFLPSWGWFLLKLLGFLCFFIWIRGTLPRLRQDQLMNFAWKFLLPLALTNLVVAGLWRWLGVAWGTESGMAWLRWPLCAWILPAVYASLGLTMLKRKRIGARSYRYAE